MSKKQRYSLKILAVINIKIFKTMNLEKKVKFISRCPDKKRKKHFMFIPKHGKDVND